jgi:glycosyltransferase involved in cell wall biosynthesis
MKILLLCYEYPPVGGGGGRIAARVAAGLARRGHEIQAVTAGMRHLPHVEGVEGVRIHRPESFRRSEDTCSVPEMALFLATSLWPAVSLCRRWKPDVIHAHFAVPTGALAYAVWRVTGTPYVLTAHLGDVAGGVPEQTDGLFRALGPLIAPIWKNAAAVTAVSTFVAGLARKANGIEARVILNGVDPVPESPQARPNKPPRILMLGRLSIQKDPLLALRALALIRDLDWSFEVIGDGPLGTDARALAASLGIADRVAFCGWQAADEVSRRLHASDVLLMTSRHEGLPVAAIEALQRGLAIVGSRIGGLADVVADGGNGLLVERTPEAFAAGLRRLLTDEDFLQSCRMKSMEMSGRFRMADRLADYEDVLVNAARRITPPSAPLQS